MNNREKKSKLTGLGRGYSHIWVNHSKNFTDPETGANTNRIEVTWRWAKRVCNSTSRRKYYLPGYLAKYIFEKSCTLTSNDRVLELLRMASEVFDSDWNGRKPEKNSVVPVNLHDEGAFEEDL